LRCATRVGARIDYVQTDSIPPDGSLSFEHGNIAGGYCSVYTAKSYGPKWRSRHWKSPNTRSRTKRCGPAVSVAAFVLGIVGTVLATWALMWNLVSHLLQGARPRLTPVVGVLTPDAGHLLNPATGSMNDTLRQTIEQFDGPLVVGVQVANVGRVPFHVAGWGMRPESAKHIFVPARNELGIPPNTTCDIAPGGHALFLTELVNAFAVIAGHKATESPSLCLHMVVFSGGRDRKSKAVPLALLKSMQNTTRTRTTVTNNQSPETDDFHRSSDWEQQSPEQSKTQSTYARDPTRLS
jgi:hypothetical protein